MISIVIPTYNNLDYLKLCLNSIKKNSFKDHEVLLHINDGSDGSLKYATDNNIKINVALAKFSSIGVDTMEDYLALKKILEYKS